MARKHVVGRKIHRGVVFLAVVSLTCLLSVHHESGFLFRNLILQQQKAIQDVGSQYWRRSGHRNDWSLVDGTWSPSRDYKGKGNAVIKTGSLCNVLHYPNTEDMWIDLASKIQSVSIPPTDFFPHHGNQTQENLRNHPQLNAWVQRIWTMFRPRLHRSNVHRMALPQLRAIRSILDRKLLDASSPPLEILVVGGSPTLGHGCPSNPYIALGKEGNFAFPACAWSIRLQDMFDAVLGMGAVRVRNVAGGGTTTDISTLIFEYGLWPTVPDIVINAHAINDAIQYHTLGSMLEVREAFQRRVEQSRCDNPALPAVIHLDDFVAEDTIDRMEETFIVADCIHRVAVWHDTMAVSYSNIVRPHVFSHLQNASTVLDVFGTPLNRHPGLMFHITVAWTIAYNLLGELSRDCRSKELSSIKDGMENPFTSIPPLHASVNKYDVAQQWEWNDSQNNASCSAQQQPCSYAWMSHRATGIRDVESLQAVVEQRLVTNRDWVAAGFPARSPKLGWKAVAPNATFTLQIPTTGGTPSTLTVVYMQSYDVQWYNSTVLVAVQQQSNMLQEFRLNGFHEQQTSISASYRVDVPHVSEGTITVSFSLTNGSTFKVLGIALCSR